MADLEDTFGQEFARHVEQKTQERRQEREKIGDESRRAIADLAINQGGFHEGEPTFEYTSENGITHNVLLMKLAEPREGSVWQMARKLESGAVSVPLEYLGEWVWSIFNDPEEAKKMEEGEWYIVVGNLGQYEPEDGGPPRDQLTPVRGVISLEEAKSMADSSMEDEGFDESAAEEPEGTPEPEPEPEDTPTPSFGGDAEDEEEEDEGAKGGLFGSSPSKEEEEPEEEPAIDTTYSEVANVVEDLADEEPEVWEVTTDHPDFDTFLTVVLDKLGLDPEDETNRKQVTEMALDRVNEGPKEQEQEEETDALF